jgi:signal peptidase II
MSKKNLAIFTVVLAILIDQISKIYVKTHFMLGEEVVVFPNWFIIHFTENNGMAWGFEFGGKGGKLFLTLFRIIAVSGIVYWLWKTIKRQTHNAVIVAISLILAGAVGNIIDSIFYGVIFDSSAGKVATLFSDKPYGELFYGKVVDMLYFPMWEGYLPKWLPFFGGDYFTFFNAIFNGADSWITIGVIILFLFNKQAFPKED